MNSLGTKNFVHYTEEFTIARNNKHYSRSIGDFKIVHNTEKFTIAGFTISKFYCITFFIVIFTVPAIRLAPLTRSLALKTCFDLFCVLWNHKICICIWNHVYNNIIKRCQLCLDMVNISKNYCNLLKFIV